jgi:ribosomal protein S18 acetylase RimI-like enzyme
VGTLVDVSAVEVESAGGLSDEELAALFTASYEGYLVPFAVDAAAVRFLTNTFDLDRDASRVALRDGERVGLANLGLRGADAWIGGVGVVPAERRRGIGRTLMEAVHAEARARGVERVWLEVIVENTEAIALYVQLGYAHVRDVEVWSLAQSGDAGEARDVDAAEAHAWIREHRVDRDPWQRDDASLAKLTETRGLAVDGAAAVVRVTAGRVSVLQLAGAEEPLRALLARARALGESLVLLNLPAGHPAGAALSSLGGRVDVRQREMLLRL